VTETHSSLRTHAARLWWNSASQLGATVLGRLSRAAAILISARVLGPDVFGRLATALAGYEMLRVIGEAGLDTRLVRVVAQDPSSAWRDIRQSILLKTQIYALLLALGTAATVLAGGWREAAVFLVVGLGAFGTALAGSTQAAVTGRLEAHALLPYQAAAGLVFFAMVFGTTITAVSLFPVALAIGFADVGGGMILGRYAYRAFGSAATARPAKSALSALRESLPIGIITILATAYARVGIALLSLKWGATGVAQYGVSYRIVEVCLLASTAVAGSVYAVTSQVESTSSGNASAVLLVQLLRRLALPFLAVTLVVVVGAAALPALFGLRYAAAVPTTRVLAYSLAPMFVNGLLTAHLYGRGKYPVVLRIAVINLLVNMGALLMLVPRWGPPGVALAVVITECVNTMLQTQAARLPGGKWLWVMAMLCLVGAIVSFAQPTLAS